MKLWRYGQAVEYLGRRYRLDGMLGSGGMADVCLAWDERERREVALKMLKSDDLDQETLNRFMKEAAQIADWQHPHILRVYESLQVELIDATNGSVLFYMVSEYARGGDLQKRLTSGRPFPLSASFALFRQLCDAVQYAHEHGVIHRDLKPLNMLFRRPESGPEEVVLSDFGLAVQINASHHTFAHGGTLAYMAPEQFRGNALPASDIFALGVILYLLCTGGLPFRRTLQDIPRVVQGQAPTPTLPSLLNPELPPALDAVLLRAMRELPAERYRQPREFWEAIERTLTMNARTFPFAADFWQNAGQTWPYDSSEQPQRLLQADQRRQLPAASSSLPGEETPEVEEGSAPWIAREKQKASPVRQPLPSHSILISPNLAEDDTPAHSSPNHTIVTRPAASSSGSTILPGPRTRTNEGEPTSRRRQPSEPPDNPLTSRRQPFEPLPDDPLTGRRQPGGQLSASGERLSYRRQPFKPPETFTDDPGYQTSHRRASRQPPADLDRQSSRRQPSAHQLAPGAYANQSKHPNIPARRARGAPNTSPHSIHRPQLVTQNSHLFKGARRGARLRVPLVASLCGLAVLILLLAILAATTFQGTLLTFLGAPITRVTLQPRSQLVQETTALNVRTAGGQLAPNEIPGRQLTTTSPTQSTTANATGSIPGKRATGQLTFINNTGFNINIQSTVITDKNGVQISFAGPLEIPANPPTVTAPGFAVTLGTAGNIPTLDLDQACCTPSNEIFVKNTAFTGGQDAQPNSVLQQKDIDGAAQSLVASGQGQAKAALQKQMLPAERVIGDAQCQTQTSADQKAGAQVKQAMVQVAVTCSETVYDNNAASQFFAHDLQREANSNQASGTAYALVGQVALTLLTVTPAPAGGPISAALQFHAQGRWVYQFKPATLRGFANLIAGKSQATARALLLQQPGVSDAQFSRNGTLPVNTSEIQFSVQTPAA